MYAHVCECGKRVRKRAHYRACAFAGSYSTGKPENSQRKAARVALYD